MFSFGTQQQFSLSALHDITSDPHGWQCPASIQFCWHRRVTLLYMRRTGEVSDAELWAANVTATQTPAVLRQAAYELGRRERVHEDVTVELEIARQSWNASIQGSQLDGYIQQLRLYPFHVVFFTEHQILAYVRQCKSQSGAVAHVDATGSIVSHIPNQNTPYYYCLLLADSCCHEAAWL